MARRPGAQAMPGAGVRGIDQDLFTRFGIDPVHQAHGWKVGFSRIPHTHGHQIVLAGQDGQTIVEPPGPEVGDQEDSGLALENGSQQFQGALMLVPRPSGVKVSNSRMMRSTWLLPLAGGMNFSTRSLNRTSPTLSLLAMALKASTPQSSAAISTLVRPVVPNQPLRLMSTASITVSSRSSSKSLTKGSPVRAVTFQSMVRTSSPGTYSRTSRNSMPVPLKTEWYSPEKTSCTRRRVRISMRRTASRISAGMPPGAVGLLSRDMAA